jgi:capsular polysaccharide transport system permease protein
MNDNSIKSISTISAGNKFSKKSYLLLVLLPFLLIAIYLILIASDRYAASAGFSVRSMNTQAGGDLLGNMTGLSAGGNSVSDSFIIIKFLESTDLLKSLLSDHDFIEIFGNEDVDSISRMKSNLKIENKLKYWKNYLKSSFTPSSGIIKFEVQAFNPKDSYELAQSILDEVKLLVNSLSERARKDTLIYAENDLKISEERLFLAREKLAEFRQKTNSLDLSASAMSQIDVLAKLEQNLIDINTRIEVLKSSLNHDAPSVKALEKKSRALELQISQKNGGLSITGQRSELSNLLAKQDKLQAEKEFAEQAYTLALASLESARVDASRNQRYLAVYSHPSLPEYPIYPKRFVYVCFSFLGLNIIWGILILLYESVRDHVMSGWHDNSSPKLNNKKRFLKKFLKLKKSPYLFFNDSNYRLLRYLRKFFKE